MIRYSLRTAFFLPLLGSVVGSPDLSEHRREQP